MGSLAGRLYVSSIMARDWMRAKMSSGDSKLMDKEEREEDPETECMSAFSFVPLFPVVSWCKGGASSSAA